MPIRLRTVFSANALSLFFPLPRSDFSQPRQEVIDDDQVKRFGRHTSDGTLAVGDNFHVNKAGLAQIEFQNSGRDSIVFDDKNSLSRSRVRHWGCILISRQSLHRQT